MNIRWFPERVEKAADKAMKQLVLMMCIQVEADAVFLCPVDTGNLQGSIDHSVYKERGNWHGIVGTNVQYAAPVEFGTKYWDGKPYLRPALANLGQNDVNRMIGLIKF